MRISNNLRFMSIAMVASGLMLSNGCQREVTKSDTNKSQAVAADDHSGWWCTEHGIPEEVCSMCSSKAAADFKAKGDWCADHNRAESQCFICDPKRAEKFTALYVAKYGTQPPAITK